jgi:hypothetical protein
VGPPLSSPVRQVIAQRGPPAPKHPQSPIHGCSIRVVKGKGLLQEALAMVRLSSIPRDCGSATVVRGRADMP